MHLTSTQRCALLVTGPMPRQARSVFQALGFWAQQRRQAIKPVLLEANIITSNSEQVIVTQETKLYGEYVIQITFFAYRHILTQTL
jgi:hypothetical protein